MGIRLGRGSPFFSAIFSVIAILNHFQLITSVAVFNKISQYLFFLPLFFYYCHFSTCERKNFGIATQIWKQLFSLISAYISPRYFVVSSSLSSSRGFSPNIWISSICWLSPYCNNLIITNLARKRHQKDLKKVERRKENNDQNHLNVRSNDTWQRSLIPFRCN